MGLLLPATPDIFDRFSPCRRDRRWSKARPSHSACRADTIGGQVNHGGSKPAWVQCAADVLSVGFAPVRTGGRHCHGPVPSLGGPMVVAVVGGRVLSLVRILAGTARAMRVVRL